MEKWYYKKKNIRRKMQVAHIEDKTREERMMVKSCPTYFKCTDCWCNTMMIEGITESQGRPKSHGTKLSQNTYNLLKSMWIYQRAYTMEAKIHIGNTT